MTGFDDERQPAWPEPMRESIPHPALQNMPQTGDRQVDEALEPLAQAHALPLAEQVEIYVGAHRALQDRLAGLDS
jgi:hypothetical protein